MSVAKFWQEIERKVNHPVDPSQRHIWNNWSHMKPRPVVLDFIQSLKSHACTVGLLPNVLPATRDEIREHNGYVLFNQCILSVEVGHPKPETEIYEILLQALPNLKAEELLFIDDQQYCLDAAGTVGMQTLRATSGERLVADTKALLATR